jgi:hypothetical protein
VSAQLEVVIVDAAGNPTPYQPPPPPQQTAPQPAPGQSQSAQPPPGNSSQPVPPPSPQPQQSQQAAPQPQQGTQGTGQPSGQPATNQPQGGQASVQGAAATPRPLGRQRKTAGDDNLIGEAADVAAALGFDRIKQVMQLSDTIDRAFALLLRTLEKFGAISTSAQPPSPGTGPQATQPANQGAQAGQHQQPQPQGPQPPTPTPQATQQPSPQPAPQPTSQPGQQPQPQGASAAQPAPQQGPQLSDAEIKELWERYGLKPEDIAKNQQGPLPGAKAPDPTPAPQPAADPTAVRWQRAPDGTLQPKAVPPVAPQPGPQAAQTIPLGTFPAPTPVTGAMPSGAAAGSATGSTGATAATVAGGVVTGGATAAAAGTGTAATGAAATGTAAAGAGAAGAAAGAGGAAAGGTAAAGGVAATLTASAGPIGLAVAAIAVSLAAAAAAAKLFADTMHSEARKVEGYSPEVSLAMGMREIREEQALMRRADSIGPELARFESDMGRMNEAAAEIWTEILELLLKWYEHNRDKVEFLIDYLHMAAARLNQVSELWDFLSAVKNLDAKGALKEFWEYIDATKRVGKAAMDFFDSELEEKEMADDPFLHDFADLSERLGNKRHIGKRPPKK